MLKIINSKRSGPIFVIVYTYLENRLLIHSYYNVHAMPTTHLAFLMNQVGTR